MFHCCVVNSTSCTQLQNSIAQKHERLFEFTSLCESESLVASAEEVYSLKCTLVLYSSLYSSFLFSQHGIWCFVVSITKNRKFIIVYMHLTCVSPTSIWSMGDQPVWVSSPIHKLHCVSFDWLCVQIWLLSSYLTDLHLQTIWKFLVTVSYYY